VLPILSSYHLINYLRLNRRCPCSWFHLGLLLVLVAFFIHVSVLLFVVLWWLVFVFLCIFWWN